MKIFFNGGVRSGQVRSECLTCTFRASCCSARLSRTQVPVPLSGAEKKNGGGGGGGGGGIGSRRNAVGVVGHGAQFSSYRFPGKNIYHCLKYQDIPMLFLRTSCRDVK